MDFMIHLNPQSPPLPPRQDTFVHLYIQWYRIGIQICFGSG